MLSPRGYPMETKLYAAKEAAVMAGVSVKTIYAQAAKGKIPGTRKIGSRVMFNKEIFDKWLEGEPVENEGDPKSSSRTGGAK